VGSAVLALYLNIVVLIVQAFLKIPFLHALAPTGTEPPLLIAKASARNFPRVWPDRVDQFSPGAARGGVRGFRLRAARYGVATQAKAGRSSLYRLRALNFRAKISLQDGRTKTSSSGRTPSFESCDRRSWCRRRSDIRERASCWAPGARIRSRGRGRDWISACATPLQQARSLSR